MIRSGLDSASLRPKEIIYTSSIKDSLTDADYVQECGPEILELKKNLFEHFQGVVKGSFILASSTSGIVASKFSENLRCRERVVVVHPTNPPQLIPLVEVALLLRGLPKKP